ncbi:MAG: hypothetical protein R2697_14135 [Ilumatobacteraceae bacterium]
MTATTIDIRPGRTAAKPTTPTPTRPATIAVVRTSRSSAAEVGGVQRQTVGDVVDSVVPLMLR